MSDKRGERGVISAEARELAQAKTEFVRLFEQAYLHPNAPSIKGAWRRVARLFHLRGEGAKILSYDQIRRLVRKIPAAMVAEARRFVRPQDSGWVNRLPAEVSLSVRYSARQKVAELEAVAAGSAMGAIETTPESRAAVRTGTARIKEVLRHDQRVRSYLSDAGRSLRTAQGGKRAPGRTGRVLAGLPSTGVRFAGNDAR